MRSVFLVVCFVSATVTIGGAAVHAEKVRCSAIRDSAMCVSEPTCWYDAAGNKGCLDGPRPDADGCTVHGSESICNVSTLNCAWNTDENKCASKAE